MSAGRKILVVGGAGYIGSHVVQELCEQGHKVTVFDNLSLGLRSNIDKRANFIEGDILQFDDLERAFAEPCDVVFHFAAWKAAGDSMINPGRFATNNISGTINLLNAMVAHDVMDFVFSSSAAVYGSPDYLPVDEKHALVPDNYYGYTKLVIEENLDWYSRLKGMRFAALRYFNATGYDLKGILKGKEKDPANLLPVVMEAAAGERDKIQVYGNDYETADGTCVRDYIHVDDLVSAHLMAMEFIDSNKESLTVNLGTGEGLSVLEVIEATKKISGRDFEVEIVGRRIGDPAQLVADSKLAEQILGWKTKHSDLETIVRSTWDVYK